MKKAKLSTALLVILAGSFGAPLISAAEAVNEVGTHESAVVLEEKEEPELPVDEEVVEGEVEGENGEEGTGEETEVETPEEKPEENTGTGNEETPPVTPGEPTGEEGTENETEGETDPEEVDELENAKENAIWYVDELLEDKMITQEEHARLIAAISAAETGDEIDDIMESIQYIFSAYKENAKANVKALYNRGDITEAEYQRLVVALEAANSVEEINEIMNSINWNIPLFEAKQKAFDEILDAFEKGKITEDEFMTLIADIDNATTIEAVNEIMARFRAHIINPTLILNTANLSNTIAEAKTLVEANYTKDSWAIFAAALANSEELLAATEIRMMTNITQVEVDSSTAALKNAMGQLVAVNGKVVDPTAPVLTSVTKTNTTNVANLPETGEKENRLMALYGMMMSGLAGLFLVKKRKAEKESL
ncbi:LPXTG cell wall anchor domain-containing protein [Vagococcus fluvialis]|uniref:LPXTG cell wall anchor domain-containing protein n=1 Tax=Vagococcus fluvialis TaxID=2738 RepID=UPI001A8C8E15|nr:LPXTG cell wall anchor domain-containing protein [Vagococcus fluvialis]MBO0442565.1 LPXTG cell wall anchor domain-containing protein [Vagococcus fluvialis]